MTPSPEERLLLEVMQEIEDMRAALVRHDGGARMTLAEGRALHTRALNLAARLDRVGPTRALAEDVTTKVGDRLAAARGAAAALAAALSRWLSPGARP